MVAKIKTGDQVKVIRGKDRGKDGKVLRVLADDRLIVEGVQVVKKHVRATQQGQQAGIVSVEAPIHRSNVMVIDPETKQPTRVGVIVKPPYIRSYKLVQACTISKMAYLYRVPTN